MTDSIRKQIVDMAIALINTSPPAGVPAADDTRLESYQGVGELPAITVLELRQESELEKEGRWSYFLNRTFTLRIEMRVAATNAASARVAMDPLYVWVAQQLSGIGQQNQTFGGLAEDCFETIAEWQYAAEDQPYTLLQLDFRVVYSTLKTDPTRTK
jgi:hypothetical protein